MQRDFTFIDLFCGIGGFHQALSALGGTCVFASDIDAECRRTYQKNYGLEPHGDITKIDENDIPDHDVLCGGFPCQAFSKAGKQKGFEDKTKGTLFFDIMRIVKAKRPKYILLENVRNLASHDNGNTWRVIYTSIRDAGYNVSLQPIIFSPHWIGIPQHRERVFIMAIRKDVGMLPEFAFNPENIQQCSIDSVLQDDSEISNLEHYRMSESLIAVFDHWNRFAQHIASLGEQIPSFPLWSYCWTDLKNIPEYADYVQEKLPDWKVNFIDKNQTFYREHQAFIDEFMKEGRVLDDFFGAKSKFEWQVGSSENPDIWQNIVQLRPSGIRVKTGTYFPALVAIVQIPIIGKHRRQLTPRECARLQSFPDTFVYDDKEQQAYKQFGNSVNVDVVKLFAEFLFDMNSTRERYSWKAQYPKINALF